MHRLLARQLRKVRDDKGAIDVDQLLALVSAAYDEHDNERRVASHATAVMAEEIEEAHRRDLLESEARVVRILHGMRDSVVACDAEDHIVAVNPAASIMFGAEVEELIDTPLAGHITIDADGVGGTRSGTLTRADGSRIDVEITTSEASIGGRSSRMVVLRDVTARRRAERQIQEQQVMLEAAQRVARLGSAVVDTVRFQGTWSRQLFELLDAPPDAAPVPETYLKAVHPDDRLFVRDVIAQAAKGKMVPVEYRLLMRDGRVKYVASQGTGIDWNEDGTARTFLFTVQDVTDRVLAEAAVRDAMRQAESANMAKSEFLATMSHEIRTPMNGVLGMTDLLLGTALDDKQLRYAKLIKLSAENLLGIINDILDVSKIEAGRMTIEEQPFSARGMIENVAEMMRPRAVAKSLTLDAVVEGNVPGIVIGDEARLRQVLVNLLGNALKFTETGSVTVHLASHKVDSARAILMCAVADTGVGIDPADQGKLFREFVQVDSSATRRFGGTGLGLAICRKLVELMGGRIWVESEVGVGSIFRFEIPVGVAQGVDTSLVVVPRSSVGRLRPDAGGIAILAVDDSEVNREVLRGYLEPLGFHVDTATNGREAIALLSSRRYAMVLMDMQMPEMDGLEATRTIRALDDTEAARTPLVMLTANAMTTDRDRSMAAGADAYLSKPIDKGALLETVSRVVLDRPRSIAPPRSERVAPVELDASRLDDVLGALGRDKTMNLVASAKESFAKNLDELDAAVVADDLERIRNVAHHLCGAVGALGLLAASRLAADIEAESHKEARAMAPLAALLRSTIGAGWRSVDRLLAPSLSQAPPSLG